MKILLTNDDGLDSPGLIPTIQELEQLGDVSVVVPRHEQSWTSKSQTRRATSIAKEYHDIEGYEIISIDGQPADCSNYGIYNLDETPDLLVSGANIGHNIGISAFFSSGTIGAALEGLFAGIPSIAVSVPYPPGSELVSKPFANAINGLWEFIDTFYHYRSENIGLANLNLPYNKEIKPLKATSVAPYHYGAIFVDEKKAIRPAKYSELTYPQVDENFEGSDVWAREKGYGSVVLLDKLANFVNPAIVANWLELHDIEVVGGPYEE